MLMVPCRGCKAIHRSGVDYDHRMLYGDWRDYHEWPDQKRSCPMCSRTEANETALPERPYKAMTFAEFGRIAERMERRFDDWRVRGWRAGFQCSDCGIGRVSEAEAQRPTQVYDDRLDEALKLADGRRSSAPFWARSDFRFDYVEGWAASVRVMRDSKPDHRHSSGWACSVCTAVEDAIRVFVVVMLGEKEG